MWCNCSLSHFIVHHHQHFKVVKSGCQGESGFVFASHRWLIQTTVREQRLEKIFLVVWCPSEWDKNLYQAQLCKKCKLITDNCWFTADISIGDVTTADVSPRCCYLLDAETLLCYYLCDSSQWANQTRCTCHGIGLYTFTYAYCCCYAKCTHNVSCHNQNIVKNYNNVTWWFAVYRVASDIYLVMFSLYYLLDKFGISDDT